MRSLVAEPGRFFRRSLAATATILLLSCSGAPAPQTSGAAPPPSSSPSAPSARVSITPQESWRDAVLYFVIVDRFADGDPGNDRNVDRNAKGTFHGGDLKGLTRHLDEIADLGATALWITPVVKNIDRFVTGAGFPDWGYHGYWADDFQRLDPRFGSEAELKTLVDEAHARGLKVLLDVVYNHAGYDSRMLDDPRTKGWFRVGAECGQDDVTTCVSGLPDFKTEQGNALAWVQGRGRTVAFDRYLQSREKVRAGHLLSPYLSSHDVPGALFQLQGDNRGRRADDLLRLGGRAPGRRLAGQPQRHAVG